MRPDLLGVNRSLPELQETRLLELSEQFIGKWPLWGNYKLRGGVGRGTDSIRKVTGVGRGRGKRDKGVKNGGVTRVGETSWHKRRMRWGGWTASRVRFGKMLRTLVRKVDSSVFKELRLSGLTNSDQDLSRGRVRKLLFQKKELSREATHLNSK